MNHWKTGGVALAAAGLCAQSAWALGPQEVWSRWQAMAQSYGIEATATTTWQANGDLTLTGVAYTGRWERIEAVYEPGTLTLSQQADGSVSAALSETSRLRFRLAPPGEPVTEGTVTFTRHDPVLVLTEDGDRLREKTGAREISVALDALTLDGEALDITANYVLRNLKMDRSYTTGGMPAFWSDLSAESAEGHYEFTDADAGTTMSNTTRSTGLRGTGELALGTLMAELAEARTADAAGATRSDAEVAAAIGRVLDSGFRLTGTTHYATYETSDRTSDVAGTFLAEIRAHDTSGEFDLDGDGLTYAAVTEGYEASLEIPGLPAPDLSVSGGRARQEVTLPFHSEDAPAPFALRLALSELEIGESVWSMFDPAAVLPRDPATLAVEVTGTVRWLSGLFSAATTRAAEPPIEPVSVTLEALRLDAAGATLTGSGAFTFDGTDRATFPGMPRPEGSASFELMGGNALLDRLTRIGVVPKDQVMMVRMMAGMLAVPGPAPDQLRSEIVIDGKGDVLVNGAPMPF